MPGTEVLLGTNGKIPVWCCVTDREGRFHFGAVSAGSLVLRARLDGELESFTAQPIEVVSGEELVQDVHAKTGPLTGRLLDTYGQALERGTVSMEQGLGGSVHVVATLKTDESGRFRARHLPQGPLLLSTNARFHANVDHQESDLRAWILVTRVLLRDRVFYLLD